MKRKDKNVCKNCGKYKTGHTITWRRKDGRVGRYYKVDCKHNVCSKCWRAIENKTRSYDENRKKII